MNEHCLSKWIVCRICLKTSETEMIAIFDAESDLAEQIADYGSIAVCNIDNTLELLIYNYILFHVDE